MADEFRFDLQRFADGGTECGADDTADSTEGDKGGKGTPDASETKTKEEQDADVQKRIDDAVNQAKARWEKECQKKADKAKKEAERLSQFVALKHKVG